MDQGEQHRGGDAGEGPAQAESKAVAAEAAAKAARASTLEPMSTTRSARTRAGEAGGKKRIESRSAESKIVTSMPGSIGRHPSRSRATARGRPRAAEKAVESAREQDDDAADHDYHVARDGGLLKASSAPP